MVDQCGKRGNPVTKTEKWIIKGMLTEKKNAKEIAKEIGRPVNMVEKYLTTLDTVVKEENKVNGEPEKAVGEPTPAEAVITPIGPAGSIAKDFFIKHGQGAEAGAKPRVSIMTKTASELGDAARKNMPEKTKNKGAVYKIDSGKIE